MILFQVTNNNAHVITWSFDREDAKRRAAPWLSGDRDKYVVTPLTNPGDRVKLDITISI